MASVHMGDRQLARERRSLDEDNAAQSEIERAIGPWTRFVAYLFRRPSPERAELAARRRDLAGDLERHADRAKRAKYDLVCAESEERNLAARMVELRSRIERGHRQLEEMRRRAEYEASEQGRTEARREQARCARAKAPNVKARLRYERLRPACFYCEGPMGRDSECDHIHPVGLGGPSTATNMIYVCRTCNRGKGAQPLRAFAAKRRLDFPRLRARLRAAGKRLRHEDGMHEEVTVYSRRPAA